MTKKIEELESVMTMEADLAELIAHNLRLQQLAIIYNDTTALSSLINQFYDLMLPLENLEAARLFISSEIAGKEVAQQTKTNINLSHITSQLLPKDAERIMNIGTRLYEVIKNIQVANQQNKLLLNNAFNFVRENVKLLTENHTKQLIDCRI